MTASTPRLATGLPVERARSRIGAYVYGDVLVLGALLTVEIDAERPVIGALAVALTTVITYVAHVVSDAIGDRLGRDSKEHAASLPRELRDALPIASAGVLPALVVLLGALGVMPLLAAVAIGVAVVALRLAAVGVVIAHWTGEPAPLTAITAGVTVALIGAAVGLLEVLVAH
ncbi:hypothetical protein QDR37_01105 [Amnibacterium sp. CER49]|uniref:hypothetical protein n=1 Tax=Amnibacterium sp. CER49 TaxID=3039161 RepID=UPI002447B7BC|nr:hypothetical protein [Amnibacterium sp. CER49]MDH2442533.1 hypothetical protein [Amnibacterium sp. CER49]